jgi:hypothetical protein
MLNDMVKNDLLSMLELDFGIQHLDERLVMKSGNEQRKIQKMKNDKIPILLKNLLFIVLLKNNVDQNDIII